MGIAIDKNNIVLPMGETEKLNTIIAPTDAINKDIEWSTSSAKVITVDQNGLVKSIGKGSALVIAKSKSSNYIATSEVKVVNSVDLDTDGKIDILDMAMIAIEYGKIPSGIN